MIQIDLSGLQNLPLAVGDFESRLDKIVSSVGFADLSSSLNAVSAIQARATWIRKNSKRTIFIGIGGSAWTPISMNDFFHFESGTELCFLDGPDAYLFRQTMGSVNDMRTSHFVFVSKSGSTLETLSILKAISKNFEDVGLDLRSQSTVICGLDPNPLLKWAEQGQVPVFEIPANVGGRYSALTPVGLLALELLNKDSRKFLNGAKWALDNRQGIIDLAKYMTASFDAHLYVTQMWIYSQRLWALGNWWQQLWSESLAKKTTQEGKPASRVSTPMVCCGPRDQHSLFQQLLDGYRDKSVIVLSDHTHMQSPVRLSDDFSDRGEFSDLDLTLSQILDSELEGFCGALKERGVPFVRLRSNFNQVESWGAFFMSWQLSVALVGEILKIDPYNQPGVELGKDLARSYLKSMNKKQG